MHRNEKGFTLMELMVVIVIVAILAAVAVPLYINYVKDALRTDAKAAIGAIVTAEQSYYLKSSQDSPGSPKYAVSVDDLIAKGFLNQGFKADVETRWTVAITTTATSFDVTAKNKNDQDLVVTYSYTQAGGGVWADGPPATP
jgi:prepilin-type N-terminal cleavage/methylation domain-containing protein